VTSAKEKIRFATCAPPANIAGMVAASGVRIGWADLPGHIQERVVTESGRRAFVKAITPAINADSAAMARREARIARLLPEHAPVPRLIGTFDTEDWVVLILEDVAGAHPRTPWSEDEIGAAAAALAELAQALTPAPDFDLPRVTDYLADDFACWDKIAAAPPADLDPWAVAHLGALRAASAHGFASLAAGETLAHCDIRADNLLVRADGRILIVDWPWAAIGPAWLDTVQLAINVIVHGGDPGRLLADVDPDAATGVVAGFTGYFHHRSRMPPPPGLPTVRAFQRFQGDALIPWLRTRFPD
jgi:aminoglycoside phosphotransferase (APT) family kinase protein